MMDRWTLIDFLDATLLLDAIELAESRKRTESGS